MADRRIIENDMLRIEVNDMGAELQVIYDKQKEQSLLWDGDPSYWNRCAPVLFPIVGALQDGTYLYKGERFSLPQHGFARDSQFEMVEMDNKKVVHKLTDNDETLQIYPFHFSLYITHELENNQIKVSWRVVNEQEEDMYFSIGAHPAFRMQDDMGSKQSNYYLEFPGKDSLKFYRINKESCVMQEEPGDLQINEGKYLIGENLFEDGVLIFKEGQCNQVGLAFSDEDNMIMIECEGFPYLGVWSKPGAPFVCLEPWYGIADTSGFDGELSEKEGIQKLNGSKTFEASYKIIIR